MNHNPLVSIIIPVYNSERYLAETINSALEQTWQNKEIIIVDDGSTDDTLCIAQGYAANHPEIKVYSQANKGACAARNYGFEQSRGEYIQFLDADDLVQADKIAKQVAMLNGSKHDIIGCHWVRFIDSIINTYGGVGPAESISRELSSTEWLINRQMMSPHAWLCPKEIISKSGGWDEGLSVNQDGEFYFRVVEQSKKVMFCPDTTVYYRHPLANTNVSKLNSYKKYESLYLAAVSYKNVLNRLSPNSVAAKKAVGQYFRELALQFYPNYPELYKKCTEQEEYNLTSFDSILTHKLKILSNTIGWKAARRLQAFYRNEKGFEPVKNGDN